MKTCWKSAAEALQYNGKNSGLHGPPAASGDFPEPTETAAAA
jgi:hypothetical protein